jgi:hypothetical protein
VEFSIKLKPMYLLVSVEERNPSGIPRVKACPGQFFPDGKEVNTTYAIQTPVTLRMENPVGTVFECEDLIEKETTGSTKHYALPHPYILRVKKS